MKKLIKILTKALSLICIASIMTVPFVGCSDKNANNNSSITPPTENISTENTENESTENVTDEENETPSDEPTQTPETDIPSEEQNPSDEPTETPDGETPSDEPEVEEVVTVKLNGIYTFADVITYNNIWYENLDEVISFFKTRDINGVYNALRKTGFVNGAPYSETINNESYDIMYRFNDTQVIKTTTINNHYVDLLASDYSEFFKIELDENNIPTVYIQYTYLNDNNEVVQTPVYIKSQLNFVANSENIMSGKNYVYQANSAEIVYSTETELDNVDAINALASMFEISEDAENKFDIIVATLTNYTANLSNDLSKLTVFDSTEENLTYRFSSITENTYSVGSLTIKLESRAINITTNIEELICTVKINDNATFTFTYNAI